MSTNHINGVPEDWNNDSTLWEEVPRWPSSDAPGSGVIREEELATEILAPNEYAQGDTIGLCKPHGG
jgi:hypothetical protein